MTDPSDQPLEIDMRIDGDVLHLRVVGSIDLPTMQRIIEQGDVLAARYGYILMLADARRTTGLDAEARKYQSDRLKQVIHPSHTAIHGANTVVRLVSNLVQRGIELVSGHTYPVSFHRDEAEARAELDAQREVLRAAVQPRR